MREAHGRNRMRYADAFRAIGNYLDASFFRDMTLVETPEGFLITGYTVTTTPRGFDAGSQALLVTDEDIDTLMEQAFARRGTEISFAATLPTVTVGDQPMRYEDVLRCIGELIQARAWGAVVVVQTGQGFQLKGRQNNTAHDTFFDAAALPATVAQLQGQRQSRKRWSWPWPSDAQLR